MRRNRYAGTCDVCSCQVKPHGGIVVRRPGGWNIRHDNCRPNLPFAHGATEIVQIDAGHFCAAVLLRNNLVIEAAPIVKYMHGWTADRVEDYCDRKSWTAKRVAT